MSNGAKIDNDDDFTSSARASGMSIAIASVGELLVEFVGAGETARHRRVGTYSGPFPSGAPGIFIDQAARCGGRCIFAGR